MNGLELGFARARRVGIAAAMLASALAFGAEAATVTVLHNFKLPQDGHNPFAALMMDESGNLFGTTQYGGSDGSGAVFRVTGAHEEVLHSFSSDDGAQPVSGLVAATSGNLYGTTSIGGRSYGTVFKLTPK